MGQQQNRRKRLASAAPTVGCRAAFATHFDDAQPRVRAEARRDDGECAAFGSMQLSVIGAGEHAATTIGSDFGGRNPAAIVRQFDRVSARATA